MGNSEQSIDYTRNLCVCFAWHVLTIIMPARTILVHDSAMVGRAGLNINKGGVRLLHIFRLSVVGHKIIQARMSWRIFGL